MGEDFFREVTTLDKRVRAVAEGGGYTRIGGADDIDLVTIKPGGQILEHLKTILEAAQQQVDDRIVVHLEAGGLGKREWAELMSTQHLLHKNLAYLLFSTSAHADFFRRPMLREFLFGFAHVLEIDGRIATDALRTVRQGLRPISLEAELCTSHLAKVSSDRPFAVIGALCVFTSLAAKSQLRYLLGAPSGCPREQIKDRLGINAERACAVLLEQIACSMHTYRHEVDLGEGASLARLFALRMLDHDLGWHYADLFPLTAKKSASPSRPARNDLLLAS